VQTRPKEIGGEKCTEIFEGEDLAGRTYGYS
jgi:hypothetical protein